MEVLETKSQLVKAIRRQIEAGVQRRIVSGTLSIRRTNGEILFQGQLESMSDSVFWNGEGTGTYYTFTRRVRLEFKGENIHALTVDGKVENLNECTIRYKY